MTDIWNNRRARAAGRIALTGGICLAALMATSAHAQVAPTRAPEPAPADEEVVVTGSRPIKESLAAALRTQRESDSLVSVVSADGVGRLPDQNIAQAVSRLPGVAIERDQGQARYISLRGAPNYWTTLSFDGINVVSPEGRDARFDSIPSAIAAQIIVSKAVTPDMPGETVAGNVNVITRSAFDYSGFKLAGKAGYGIAEYGSRPQYEASLVISDRFQLGGGELGILVSGSYFDRAQITDNFETDYERVAQDTRPGNQTRFWAHETENKLYRLTRRNWSSSIRLDWKPDADNTISARSLFTIFTDDEARDNYRFDLDDRQGDLVPNTADCARTVNPTPTTSGYADVCIGNTPQRGTVYGVDIRQRATLRAFRQSIFTNTLTGTHSFGDGWQFMWLGNFTRSKDDRSVVGEASYDSPGTRTLRPTIAYDFSNRNLGNLALFNTVQLTTPTRFQAGAQVTAIDSFAKTPSSLTVLDAVDTTEAYTAKFVLTRETQFLGADATFKVGFQFDQRTKIANERQILLNTAAQFNTVGLPQDYNQFSLNTPFQGQIPLGYAVQPPSAKGMVEVFSIDTHVLLAGEKVLDGKLADDGSEVPTTKLDASEPWAVPATDAERALVANLERRLKASKARWKIVIGHHPFWSSSGGKFEQARTLRAVLLPTLCRYADLYLAGHEHTLEVATDSCATAVPGAGLSPLPNIVSGAAAKQRPLNTAFMAHQQRNYPQYRPLYVRGMIWGFAHLTLTDNAATVTMISTPDSGSGQPKAEFTHTFTRRGKSSD